METDNGYLRCNHCGELKPATPEYFPRHRKSKTGITTPCRLCAAAKARAWYAQKKEADPDYVKRRYHETRDLEKRREKYHQNQARELAQRKAWRAKNPTTTEAMNRRYYSKNQERIRERIREWRRDHPEQYRTYNREWLENHPDEASAMRQGIDARRRARIRNLPDDFTGQDWHYCLHYWKQSCAICGGNNELHADHWIALADPNCPGTVKENMIPLCAHCNHTKWATGAEKWLVEKLGAEAAEQKLAEIQVYFEHVQSVKTV